MDSYSTLLITLIIAIFGIIIKVRFRKAKIVRNLFQKVLILVQKAPKLARFKKDLEKKLKISKTIAEIPKA